MGNICAACHRIKPDNPSRFHRDCWYKVKERERVKKYTENMPQAVPSGTGRKNKRHGISNAPEAL